MQWGQKSVHVVVQMTLYTPVITGNCRKSVRLWTYTWYFCVCSNTDLVKALFRSFIYSEGLIWKLHSVQPMNAFGT